MGGRLGDWEIEKEVGRLGVSTLATFFKENLR